MQLTINGAVVGFLVNNETFCAGLNNWNIFLGFHRGDFDRDRGKIVAQSADAFGKIIVTNEFWMFAGDEKELSKTRGRKIPRFLYHFADRKSNAQNWILAGKSAVTATVDAFIGKIERGAEPHGSAIILTREGAGRPGE